MYYTERRRLHQSEWLGTCPDLAQMGVGVIMMEVKRNDLAYMHSTVHDYARNREKSYLAKDFIHQKK